MSAVDYSEVVRNLGLLLFAAVGIWFAGQQFFRAQRRDDLDALTKAIELIDSTDEGRSVRAYLLLRELETSPSVGNLAKSMVNDYIENAESEIVERIQQTERHREALND